MNWPATIANSLWVGSCLPAWAGFKRALSHPAQVQWLLLQQLLERNRDCAFGRAHGFREIKDYHDFVRLVPLAEYEDFAPWIERVRGGENHVLTSERVTHLIPTSGSTGARKFIPFTAGLQQQFDRAISPWIADLAWEHPGILFGPAYWSISPSPPPPAMEPSAVPVGFADDASYLGGAKGWLVRAAMVVPDKLGEGHDLEAFRFRTLLCLVRQQDLRLISIWHPSFLSLLLDALPHHWENILATLRQETPSRVRELEIADPRKPETFWPHLGVISCWGDAQASLPLADLRQRFPQALVQPKGLLATEACMTIPFAGKHPVAVCSHFFEFIDSQGRCHLVHELREQEEYEVVVTTAGGLWRYRLHDRIQVSGFVANTPSLQFVGRMGNVSDLFGEKLSEIFVVNAIKEVLAPPGIKPRLVFLAPDHDETGWRYTLYVEGNVPVEVAARLDLTLRKNPNYSHCRDLGQLQPARLFVIKERGYEAFSKRLVLEGRRLGDIKPIPLLRTTGWSNTFTVAKS